MGNVKVYSVGPSSCVENRGAVDAEVKFIDENYKSHYYSVTLIVGEVGRARPLDFGAQRISRDP
jgi:hypothetical protein